MFDAFMRKAERNTRSNVETCGILAGELVRSLSYDVIVADDWD